MSASHRFYATLFRYLSVIESLFYPCPDGLSPAQQQRWHHRCQVAERLLDRQAATAPPDAETLTHLQHYVSGTISLGQMIGRVLDCQARR